MLTNEREEKICEKYSVHDENGIAHCYECPLIKGNPNRWDFRCKANSHYDKRERDWIYDKLFTPKDIVVNTTTKQTEPPNCKDCDYFEMVIDEGWKCILSKCKYRQTERSE